MKLIIVILTITLLAITSCDTTNPKPPEKPPGYQEDIPWPSLADSPWPMAHHDPQSTGRSKFAGPVLGEKLWEYEGRNSFLGGVIIGRDSLIYAITADSLGLGIYNFSLQGNVNFIYRISPYLFKHFTAPLIRRDGSIVYFDGIRTINAIKPNGASIWEYSVLGEFDTRNKSLSIDKDGNIYFTSYFNKLIVLTPNGDLNWELTDERIGCTSTLYVVSFSPDGKTAYIPGCGVSVVAVNVETQQIKWTFGETTSHISVLVDSGGNIYFEKHLSSDNAKSTFVSLNPNGTLRWEYDNQFESGLDTSPAIDKYGNIYFGSDTLYSVDYFGNLRWKIGLDGYCDAPIVCDEFGKIYVTTVSNDLNITNLISINVDGSINWIYTEEGVSGTNGSAAVGYNNTIYIPTIYGSKILAIH